MTALSATGKLYLWGTYKDNEGFLGYSAEQRTEEATPRIFPGLESMISHAITHNFGINVFFFFFKNRCPHCPSCISTQPHHRSYC